jgi:phosphoglycerate dehydrogenase-like enzyme
MAVGRTNGPHIHFETRASKPRVFRITPDLIAEAKARNNVNIPTSLGEDWNDLSSISRAVGIVTAVDLLADPKFPRQRLAEAAPDLRWIHVTGAGIEPLLPLDWIPPHVTVTNNSGVHAEKIRESAAMMLLMLNARIPAIASNQRKSHWQQIFTTRIQGRTVAIIGVGDMGGAVAQAARQLGLRVLGVRRSGLPHPDVDRMFTPNELDRALSQADFVVLAAPLTSKTAALVNRERIAQMKEGAGLVNIGRAGLVEQDALLAALRTGRLSGAIVDVFDPEPLPAGSPLWRTENLMLIPHVSSDDEQEYLPKTFDLTFENVRRLVAGQALLNVIDREREY